TLLEIGQESFLVRCPCRIRPAFVTEGNMGFVGRDEVRIGNEFLKSFANRKREGLQMLHLRPRAPLESVPHFYRRSRFDVGAPNTFSAVNVSGEASGQKTAIHRRTYILVVLFGPALRAVLITSIPQSEHVFIASVVWFPVQRGLRMRRLKDLGQVPIPIMLTFVPHLVECHP